MENTKTFHTEPVDLPEGMTVMIMGIVSVIATWVIPGVGIIPAIIGLVKYQKQKELYFDEPEKYTKQSYDYLKAGHVTSIIGLIISGLIILSVIILVVVLIFMALYPMPAGKF